MVVKNGDESNGIESIKKITKRNKHKSMNFESKNHQLGVSKNRGTPKRMVYNGKPY